MKCRLSRNANYDDNVTTINTNISKTHRLILPCKSKQEQKVIKSVNNFVKRVLPKNHASKHVYKSKKRVLHLTIKDQTKLEHKHGLTYLVKCSETY